MSADIAAELRRARQSLLDLSTANRLLSLPKPGGTARVVAVHDEKAVEVFRLLVTDKRILSFLHDPAQTEAEKTRRRRRGATEGSLAEPDLPPEGEGGAERRKGDAATEPVPPADTDRVATSPLRPFGAPSPSGGRVEDAAPPADADDPDPDPDGVALAQPEENGDGDDIAARHRDTRLHTALSSERLQKRLFDLAYDARLLIEEQGVNILYFAIGALRWREADASAVERRAPLLLVPVRLERKGAGSRFTMAWTEDEIVENISLRARLKNDFGIELPEMPAIEELDIAGYVEAVGRAVGEQAGWSVAADDMVLGLFSFAKYLMYRDLDADNWPSTAPLERHPFVAALLGEGFPGAEPSFAGEARIDAELAPERLAHVVDADGSQTVAIERARRGESLVVQGPPGTGKSQTIANVIAAALCDGKSVLFVAEKMAALDVVKRRLDAAHVGDACLELHSHKANKRTLLAELKRTLELGRPVGAPDHGFFERLHAVRGELNAVPTALNEPLPPSGLTPQAVMGHLVRLRALATVCRGMALAGAEGWTKARKADADGIVRDLATRIARMGAPDRHPWRGVERGDLIASDRAHLAEDVAAAARIVAALLEGAKALAKAMSQPLPADLAGIERLVAMAREIGTAPDPDPAAMASGVWKESLAAIFHLLEAGKTHAAAVEAIGDRVVPAAWTVDLTATRQAIAGASHKLIAFLFDGAYRRGLRELASVLKDTPPKARAERLVLIDALIAGRRAAAEIERGGYIAAAAFGARWAGLRSDWNRLAAIHGWVAGLATAGMPANFPMLYAALADRPSVVALGAGIGEARTVATRRIEALAGFVQLDLARAFAAGVIPDGARDVGPGLPREGGAISYGADDGRPPLPVPPEGEGGAPRRKGDAAVDTVSPGETDGAGPSPFRPFGAPSPSGGRDEETLRDRRALGATSIVDVPLAALVDRLAAWRGDPEGLDIWRGYRTQERRAVDAGLGDIAAGLAGGGLDPATANDVLDHLYYDTLIRDFRRRLNVLADFDGEVHGGRIGAFRTADRQRIELAQLETALAHYQTLPKESGGIGPLGVVRREIEKKTRHLPIRRLMQEAGAAVQAIKPVFMMSPLSVAQFLPAGALAFDLLVVDEASQVEPVDALGAIARCRQIVVVGDQKQLPPTRFFARALDSGLPDDEGGGGTADLESVLGLCAAKGLPSTMLRWHYRSRHPSLIAVSNKQFYDSRLFIVPSPHAEAGSRGLIFRHLPQGVYDRGGGRDNPIEARAVAEAVIAHVRVAPDKSLGVGTFSIPQRRAILDELELLRRHNPDLEHFFAAGGPEPFFVKNLENIQGDERDVILISVGYGRDRDGHLTLSFGPLNAEGGERRLNVLITRAKERLEVFSSIRADDIDLERARSAGVVAFKLFLHYAERGVLDVAQASGRDVESPFEDQVMRALRGEGYDVQPQVGIAGFFIDLAVVDPHQPSRYLLGIECDGATYHASRSARDRDRLRQLVLERHGWTLYRIWSADWWQRPEEQLRRVVARIEDLKAASAAELAERRAAQAAAEAAAQNRIALAVDATDQGTERRGADSSPPIDLESRTIDGPFADDAPGPGQQRVAGSPSVGAARPVLRRVEEARADAATMAYVESDFAVPAIDLVEAPRGQVAECVARVIAIEGPIHRDEIVTRMRTLWGYQRAGSAIRAAVEASIETVMRLGGHAREGDFVWRTDQPVRPRDRSDVRQDSLRRAESLPPPEVRAAILDIIDRGLGAAESELPRAVAALLGVSSAPAAFKDILAAAAERLAADHHIEHTGDYWRRRATPAPTT